MSEEIPAWAQRRARDLIPVDMGLIVTAQDIADAFARYIMKHEQPPVDPDVIAVREIAACFHVPPGTKQSYMRGDYDGDYSFSAALAAYKKHKEAGE